MTNPTIQLVTVANVPSPNRLRIDLGAQPESRRRSPRWAATRRKNRHPPKQNARPITTAMMAISSCIRRLPLRRLSIGDPRSILRRPRRCGQSRSDAFVIPGHASRDRITTLYGPTATSPLWAQPSIGSPSASMSNASWRTEVGRVGDRVRVQPDGPAAGRGKPDPPVLHRPIGEVRDHHGVVVRPAVHPAVHRQQLGVVVGPQDRRRSSRAGPGSRRPSRAGARSGRGAGAGSRGWSSPSPSRARSGRRTSDPRAAPGPGTASGCRATVSTSAEPRTARLRGPPVVGVAGRDRLGDAGLAVGHLVVRLRVDHARQRRAPALAEDRRDDLVDVAVGVVRRR